MLNYIENTTESVRQAIGIATKGNIIMLIIVIILGFCWILISVAKHLEETKQEYHYKEDKDGINID